MTGRPDAHPDRDSSPTSARVAQEFFEQEAQLALQDRIQRETADSKNALESYVYSLRSKLSEQLSAYAPATTRDSLIERLNDMEVHVPPIRSLPSTWCIQACFCLKQPSATCAGIWLG